MNAELEANRQRHNDISLRILELNVWRFYILPVDLVTDHGRTSRRKDELTQGTVARQYEQPNPVGKGTRIRKRKDAIMNNEDN